MEHEQPGPVVTWRHWAAGMVLFCLLLLTGVRYEDGVKSGLSRMRNAFAPVTGTNSIQHSSVSLQRDNLLLRSEAALERARLKRENDQLRARTDELVEEVSRLRAINSGRPPDAKSGAPPPPPPPAAKSSGKATAVEGDGAMVSDGSGGRPRRARLGKPSTAFSRARVVGLAVRKQVILTFVNHVRVDFAMSWEWHVHRLGLKNYLVGAADKKALNALLDAGTPCFDMGMNLPVAEWAWGSPSFKSLGPHKIEMIYKALQWGLEVLITDIDAFVLRDPFPYMARYPSASFLTTSDHLGNTTSDDGLETHSGIHTAFNIGYMFFRDSSLPLVEEWRRVIRSDPANKWDQGEFNRLARHQWDPRSTKGLADPRLFYSYKKKVIGGVLPLALFCGGHNYFVSQFAQRSHLEPYSIHTTYQYAAAAGKRHRLREARVWIDSAEYYDPPGGLLTYAPRTPRELIYPAGGMDTNRHIALVKHQLRQLRSALAIAHTLGRVLVLPPFVCGYDKYWGPLYKGVIPGTHTWALPIFNCPLDHVLEVGMLKPTETVREYSFLANPRTPASVRSSFATVALAASGGKEAVDRLRAVKAKVLNVSTLGEFDVLEAPGLLSRAEKTKFIMKFGSVSGGWCCAPVEERKRGMPHAGGWRLSRI